MATNEGQRRAGEQRRKAAEDERALLETVENAQQFLLPDRLFRADAFPLPDRFFRADARTISQEGKTQTGFLEDSFKLLSGPSTVASLAQRKRQLRGLVEAASVGKYGPRAKALAEKSKQVGGGGGAKRKGLLQGTLTALSLGRVVGLDPEDQARVDAVFQVIGRADLVGGAAVETMKWWSRGVTQDAQVRALEADIKSNQAKRSRKSGKPPRPTSVLKEANNFKAKVPTLEGLKNTAPKISRSLSGGGLLWALAGSQFGQSPENQTPLDVLISSYEGATALKAMGEQGAGLVNAVRTKVGRPAAPSNTPMVNRLAEKTGQLVSKIAPSKLSVNTVAEFGAKWGPKAFARFVPGVNAVVTADQVSKMVESATGGPPPEDMQRLLNPMGTGVFGEGSPLEHVPGAVVGGLKSIVSDINPLGWMIDRDKKKSDDHARGPQAGGPGPNLLARVGEFSSPWKPTPFPFRTASDANRWNARPGGNLIAGPPLPRRLSSRRGGVATARSTSRPSVSRVSGRTAVGAGVGRRAGTTPRAAAPAPRPKPKMGPPAPPTGLLAGSTLPRQPMPWNMPKTPAKPAAKKKVRATVQPVQLRNDVQLTLDGRQIFNAVARQNQVRRLAT